MEITTAMTAKYEGIISTIEEHPTSMNPPHRFHCMDTAAHIRLVTELAEDRVDAIDTIGVVTAMFHDLGKLETWDEETGSFRKHDAASERIAREAGLPEMACRVIGLHSWVYNIDQVSPKGVRKFIRRLTTDLDAAATIKLYIDLMECDACGFSPEGARQRKADIQTFNKKVSVALVEMGITS